MCSTTLLSKVSLINVKENFLYICILLFIYFNNNYSNKSPTHIATRSIHVIIHNLQKKKQFLLFTFTLLRQQKIIQQISQSYNTCTLSSPFIHRHQSIHFGTGKNHNHVMQRTCPCTCM